MEVDAQHKDEFTNTSSKYKNVSTDVNASRLHYCDEEFVQGSSVPSKAKSLSQLLTYTTVENLLANGGNIISLKEDDTVESVLKTFKDTEIQAAPVYDANGKFVRILKIADIFYYFCGITHDDMEAFFTQKIKRLWANDILQQESLLVPIGTSLAEVIKTLATGIHHMFVVQFIAKNISLVPQELRNLPVHQFMKQIVQVKTIPSDTSTRESFEYLFMDKISAAAVVHSITGAIMDTISTTDMVGVVYDRFKHLDHPVVDFLNATRRTKALKPPITCKLDDTLEYVIMKLASTGVHRLWVVDEATGQRYLGLVNLANVLEAITQTFE